MSLVKLPKMSQSEIKELLRNQFLCRIAFKGAEYPYVAPFQYVYLENTLYFHFTDYGKKKRLIEMDNRVCVEIEQFDSDLSNYSFVVIRGKLVLVTDPQEKAGAIMTMANVGQRQLSRNFLSAHGFDREKGWTELSPEKPLIIVKLSEPVEVVGLKSF